MPRIDLTGHRYGRWLVTGFSHANKRGQSYWHCKCDCGTVGVIRGGHLRTPSKPNQSCGCYQMETVTKHGYYTKGKEDAGIMRAFISYEGMMNRVKPDAQEGYAKYYAAKGIAVTEQRWIDSVHNFIADMGPCPENHSLDRINNNKGYSKDNCQWATASEQMTNRSIPSITPEMFGVVTREIAAGKANLDISKEFGVGASTVRGIRHHERIYCTRPEYLAAI